MSTDFAFQGSMERADTKVSFNGVVFHVINIADSSTGKLATYDPALKIYTVQDMSAVRPIPLGVCTLLPCYTPGGHGVILPIPLPTIPDSISKITVTDRGMEKVGHNQAHHWNIAWTSDTSDDPFDAADVWTDDAAAQPIDPVIGAAIAGGGSLAGEIDKLKTVLTAQPVKIVINLAADAGSTQPSGTVTYELHNQSDKPVDNGQFAAPTGLTNLSQNDFLTEEEQQFGPRLSGAPAPRAAPTVTPNGPNRDTGTGFPGQAPNAPINMP
jgi:hypothetical protein